MSFANWKWLGGMLISGIGLSLFLFTWRTSKSQQKAKTQKKDPAKRLDGFVVLHSGILLDQKPLNPGMAEPLIEKGKKFERRHRFLVQEGTKLPLVIVSIITQLCYDQCPHKNIVPRRGILCQFGCDTVWYYTGKNAAFVSEYISDFMLERGCDQFVVAPWEYSRSLEKLDR